MSTLDEVLAVIRTIRPRNIVFFTGAGVSAESGIPTFRGTGGVWRNFPAQELATPQAFQRDPKVVWEWYEWRRGLIREARPNAAHEAIARLPGAVVITQNVDGLHARAGARDVIELHGNIFQVRCVRDGTTELHVDPFPDVPPRHACGALLRPGVVWFGESLPYEAVGRATALIKHADLLLVIGTSGVVYPAAGFVALCDGMTVEINPEASSLSSACHYTLAEKAGLVTPPIVEALLEVR